MTAIDSVQQLFDSALSGVADSDASSAQQLHQRLHRRHRSVRFAGVAAMALTVVIATTVVLLPTSGNDTANAVTLYPTSTTLATSAQLVIDRNVLAERLHAVGYSGATVSVVNDALVVTNGPKYLADPTAMLTSSPKLFIRKVLCMAGPPKAPAISTPLPTHCSSHYAIQPVTPTGSGTGGFTAQPQYPDPALSRYPTTTRAADLANPRGTALLPLGYSGGQRVLVGPTLLTLTPHVVSAKLEHSPIGGWLENVRLDGTDARTWDVVARRSFHLILAIDVNGTVVDAPVIEPIATTFVSFDGSMTLSAPSKRGALALMAALRSGPLAVPLSTEK